MEVLELDPNEVIVPADRMRKDLGDLTELAESLKNRQIHPIRITAGKALVAGERRLRACMLAGIKVQAIILENTSPLELKEIELRENLDRKDMTWVERDNGLAELDALKKKELGQSKSGKGEKGWSYNDTADLVNMGKTSVVDAVKMTEAIKAFPELATMKSHNEAKKKLDKMVEKLAIAALSDKRKESATGQSILADENFIVGDAFVGLKSLPAESIDFCNVDTPYGIDLTEQKKIQTGIRTDDDYQEWKKEDYVGNIQLVAKECFRVLKPNSWMIFWYGQEWYFQVRSVLEDSGFKVDKIPAIWYGGPGAAQTIAVEVNLGRAYEPFFICRKGDPILIQRGRPNVFAFDKISAQKKIHPTEKPLGLMVDIFKTFTLPGYKCLIPFIGSGNDLRASYIQGCHAFGWDLNQDVKNRFLLRVEEDIANGLYGRAEDCSNNK